MKNQGIIGAVCGDIIGSAYEFHPTKNWNFELFTPRSKFTDDTVMTCAVAEWLMTDPDHTHEKLIKIMHRYGEEYPYCGYGKMFKQWLEEHRTEPYYSYGNGSAMRVSPVGYYATTLEEALQLAQISAEVTHDHPEGIIGAQAVAGVIFLLRSGGYTKMGKAFLKNHCYYDLDKMDKEWNDICHFYSFDVTCQGSVPEAIYCGLKSFDYKGAVRDAVSLGGDADTQAAIAGSIKSACKPVPDDILNPCIELLDPPLVDIIEQFNDFVDKRPKPEYHYWESLFADTSQYEWAPEEEVKAVKEAGRTIAQNLEKHNIDYRSLLPVEVQQYIGLHQAGNQRTNLTCEQAIRNLYTICLQELNKAYQLYQKAPQVDRTEEKQRAKEIVEDCKKYNVNHKAILTPEARQFYGVE